MSITVNDINNFHQFAIARIEKSNQDELTIDDLFVEWDSASNRKAINQAIRDGIADVDAGRTRPLEEVNERLKAKLKLGE